MVYILHGFDNVTDEFKPKSIRQEVHYIESPRTKRKIFGWLVGCMRVLRLSKKGDTILCWYDFQAVLLYWMCRITLRQRRLGCLNLLLKNKETLKNRIVRALYRSALLYKDFYASVTSPYYGELLKKWLCIDFNYVVIHDPYHKAWERKCISLKHRVFVGGNARNWSFIIKVAHASPNVHYLFVMSKTDWQQYRNAIPSNVKVKCNIPFDVFLQEMADSTIVAMPLNTEAPAGLLVIYQAAGCGTFVMATKTETTKEYINPNNGCVLKNEVEDWVSAINYWMNHETEREEKAKMLHNYISEVCSKEEFDKGIQKLVDRCESKKL